MNGCGICRSARTRASRPEVYLPFSQSGPYFIVPRAQIEARNVSVLDANQDATAEYRVRSFSYGLDFGREYGNWGEIRTGYLADRGKSHVRVGDPTLPTGEFDSKSLFLRLSYDKLDNINFPAAAISRRCSGRASVPGSARIRPPIAWSSTGLAATTLGRQTAVLWTSLGTALNEPTADLRTLFPLGGFLESVGHQGGFDYRPALRHFAAAAVSADRPRRTGLPRRAGLPGRVARSGERVAPAGDASFGDARKDASVFLGLDTPIGPVYLATGFEEGGREAFYLFLGRTF